MMHDIEKQQIIEAKYKEIWNIYTSEYCIPYGKILKDARVVYAPELTFICAGIGYAGRFYGYHPFLRCSAIEINTAYYEGIESNESMEETIVHELAHWIQYATLKPNSFQWHGPEFRAIMQSMGYTGNTYHHMSKNRAKMVAMKSKTQLFQL